MRRVRRRRRPPRWRRPRGPTYPSCPPIRTGSCGRTCDVCSGTVASEAGLPARASRAMDPVSPTPCEGPLLGSAIGRSRTLGCVPEDAVSSVGSLGPAARRVNRGLPPRNVPDFPAGTGRWQDARVADHDLPRATETVVIGAGHAGLMMSWHLQRAGREHVVLERRDDARRRLAGPLGRVHPRVPELDERVPGLPVRRRRPGRVHAPRRDRRARGRRTPRSSGRPCSGPRA